MQVELSTVVAFVTGLLSTGLGIYVALLRYTVGQREKEIDRRLTHCDVENAKLVETVHALEKTTIKQQGDINLVQRTHDDVKGDVEEVKRTMITKAEFEPRITNLERTANQILSELRGRYPSGQAMHAVTPPAPKR